MNTATRDDQPIDQIAYCSLATPELGREGLNELIEQSKLNNQRQGITGLLMAEQGVIIQWIEGPGSIVNALWEKIQNDPRHHCIVKLIQRHDVSQRLFEQWSLQRASRNEMIAIIREARQLANNDDPTAQQHPWYHAISTLSILIDPDFSPYYVRPNAQRRSQTNHASKKE